MVLSVLIRFTDLDYLPLVFANSSYCMYLSFFFFLFFMLTVIFLLESFFFILFLESLIRFVYLD